MENRDLKAWLNLYDDDAEVKCWVKIGDDELSHPNMATILRDEIFDWQDKLDDIDYVENNDKNMAELFKIADGILDELESRLQLSPEFVKSLEEIEAKLEAGDTSDFVEFHLPERTFWDYVNDFVDAEKIREYVESGENLLRYVTNRLPDLDIYIENSYLYITKKGNKSVSTSIIADLLNIEAKDIDDSQWEQSIYRIKLQEQ